MPTIGWLGGNTVLVGDGKVGDVPVGREVPPGVVAGGVVPPGVVAWQSAQLGLSGCTKVEVGGAPASGGSPVSVGVAPGGVPVGGVAWQAAQFGSLGWINVAVGSALEPGGKEDSIGIAVSVPVGRAPGRPAVAPGIGGMPLI